MIDEQERNSLILFRINQANEAIEEVGINSTRKNSLL